MKMADNSTKTPVNGDIAVLLKALRSHTYMSEAELRMVLERHSGTKSGFKELLLNIEEKELIESGENGYSLSEEGQKWVDEHAVEYEVEEEDLGSGGTPTIPYAVAKLKMEEKHISLFQALRKIENNQIDLRPEFQRAFVWDRVKQSRLIESVLIRIPLPAFYLDATDQINWSVVDGLQRLNTLYKYCREKSFPLEGLQFLHELEGLRFEELPSKYKVLIEDDTQLLFYNLMPGTPVEAKFTIFSRVNTGGMQLTPQEIRHALNQGPVTMLLKELAEDNTFRMVTQGVVESLRMADRELILRALSFMHLGVERYKEFNELDAFLLEAMSSLNQAPKMELEKLRIDFIKSLEKVHEAFGKYAFRKFSYVGGRRSPFNKALFEAWIVSIRPYEKSTVLKNKSKLMASFANMVERNSTFVRSISSSTSSYSAVNTRFSSIETLIAGIIS
jgi:hypothetical protein